MNRETRLPDIPPRQVEVLAQRLYEELNPRSLPWGDRTRAVREAWLQEAWRRLRNLGGERR